jgi:uncharacterized protein (TIGR02145 family)
MKLYSLFLLMLPSLFVGAQIQQNINKNTGTVSNNIATIDSIRFNGSSTNMEVVLQNGTIESHSISDILNVNFVSVIQHSCGADSIHNPSFTYGTMTDQDGNTYKTIVIGTQEWMAENLKVSHYRNGDLIPVVLNNSTWISLNTGATCWYYNDSASYNCPYGKLYNWFATVDARDLCPTGWHMPDDTTWSTLTTFLGGEPVAGGKMKSSGLQFWNSPNFAADNISGFSGLPGGFRLPGGDPGYIGQYCHLWSSTENGSTSAWYRMLIYGNSDVSRFTSDKNAGFYVRCIKD